MIPLISISNGEPIMALPLALVVSVSMLKDGYEDFMRAQDDKKENNSITTRIRRHGGREEEIKWHEVRVGDFIKVRQDGFFPADMIIIASSNADGTFYVETKSLDGETNLKTRNLQDELKKC